MPAVGDHRHRTEQRAADDLGQHHCRGDRDDRPCPALVPVVAGAEKSVVVLPRLDGMAVRGDLM